MLKEFFEEWNNALAASVVVNEVYNEEKTALIKQDTSLTFRNVEILTFSHILKDDTNKPTNEQYWITELHCPSTNKFLQNIKMSPARCAVAILNLITPGTTHEDAVAARAEKRQQVFVESVTERRRKHLLKETVFTPQEVEIIVNDMKTRVGKPKTGWDEVAMELLVEFSQFITGRELESIGITLGHEERYHVSRMYTTAATLLLRSTKDAWGNTVVPSFVVKQEFMSPPKESWSYGICTVRLAYTKMYDKAQSVGKLMHTVKILCKVYQHMVGENLDLRMEKVRAYRDKRQSRINKNEAPPAYHKKQTQGGISPINMKEFSPMETSIGTVFGNVLDKVQNNISNNTKKKKNEK